MNGAICVVRMINKLTCQLAAHFGVRGVKRFKVACNAQCAQSLAMTICRRQQMTAGMQTVVMPDKIGATEDEAQAGAQEKYK